MRRFASLLLTLTLAACGTTWSKPGVKPEAAAQDYAECRHAGELAIRRDSNIDTDILATRGQDWHRSDVLTVKRDLYADSNAVRTGDIVTNCMLAKGYTRGR
jgi:hypothetical protein